MRVNASYVDTLESELGKELENGRLVRLLCKFGFINERPEFDHDVAWSEVGDRYVIKLFRDFVFHQVNEHGRPVIDMSHVLSSLNKVRRKHSFMSLINSSMPEATKRSH